MACEAYSVSVFCSGEIIFRLLHSFSKRTCSERDFSMLGSYPSFAPGRLALVWSYSGAEVPNPLHLWILLTSVLDQNHT